MYFSMNLDSAPGWSTHPGDLPWNLKKNLYDKHLSYDRTPVLNKIIIPWRNSPKMLCLTLLWRQDELAVLALSGSLGSTSCVSSIAKTLSTHDFFSIVMMMMMMMMILSSIAKTLSTTNDFFSTAELAHCFVQGGSSCAGAWTYAILSRIKICRYLRTSWRSLDKKSAFLGQKQCFLDKKCTMT